MLNNSFEWQKKKKKKKKKTDCSSFYLLLFAVLMTCLDNVFCVFQYFNILLTWQEFLAGKINMKKKNSMTALPHVCTSKVLFSPANFFMFPSKCCYCSYT